MEKNKKSNNNKIIVITGPTATGKTKLSVELAKLLDGEIINADSTQVYKEMNIGTAKVTESEKENIPHHLFDIKKVTDNYTIYDYQKDCRKKINEIMKRGKTPILVGGTGLYIKAALYNYEFKDEEYYSEYNDLTNEEILEKIKEVENTDIHVNNRKRLVRELNKINNNSLSTGKANEKLYDFITIGLTTDRDNLYNRINKRVDSMLKDGLIGEAKYFYDMKLNTKAINTPICYKELFMYFNNEISLDDALDLIRKRSRNYAKRQYTFFKHQMDVKWFDVNYDDFNKTIKEVYNYIENSK